MKKLKYLAVWYYEDEVVTLEFSNIDEWKGYCVKFKDEMHIKQALLIDKDIFLPVMKYDGERFGGTI